MNKLTKVVACLLVVGAVVQSCGTRIDQPTKNLIARAYALAMTDSNAFFAFVSENPAVFAKGEKWDRAVTRLGKMLVDEGVKSIPNSAIEASVYDIAGSVGRPDLAPKVYEDMRKSAADLMTMGNMLQSMPSIVEGVIHGDATAYEHSMFGFSASVLENARAIMLPDDWAALKKMSYQVNEWMMLQYAQQI